MTEKFVSGTQVAALAVWALVAVLMTVGLLTMLVNPESWRWAGLCAAFGCATSAVAATLSIKVYAVRLCSLIRVSAGLESEGVRPIR